MKPFFTFLSKDFVLALRGKELIFSTVTLSLLTSVLFTLGIQSAFIAPPLFPRLLPTFYWCGLLFISLLTVSRALSQEKRFNASERLLLSPKLIPSFYLAKVSSTAVITTVSAIFFLFLLSLFLNQLQLFTLPTLSIIPLFVVGFNALAIICASMTLSSTLQDVLLSLILIPLSLPLFFAGIELTYLSQIGFGEITGSPWLTLILLMDIVYLWVGSVVFMHTLKD